ncbi:MAG: DnaJ C-terminal domain-containing protein [Candidatus Eisenbacteria bacterium]
MPVAFRDYYKVLEVPRDATEADIRKAFRKLALRYHPDVATDKATADARFKEVNEANEVLSDPEKRRRYDQLGEHWDKPERPTHSAGAGYNPAAGSAQDFHFGGTGFSDFFETFFGSGSGSQSSEFGRTRNPRPGSERFAQRGRDIEGDILVTLEEVFLGATRIITLQRSDPRTGQSSTQNLRVKIPVGVRQAQRIRLAGKGHEGEGGGEPGDLFLRVRLATHPEFAVRGADLFYELDVAPWEAVLGTTVQIRTLDGTVSLKVPAGTAAGQQLRLRHKGLPESDGTRGHLFVGISVQVPPDPTPQERALWEEMARQSTFDPRKPS